MIAGTTDGVRAVGVLCAAVAMTAAAGVHAQPATQLRVGETVRAEHGAADARSYAFAVEDGGPFLLRVEQRGLDLRVSLESPDGRSRRRYTSTKSPEILRKSGPKRLGTKGFLDSKSSRTTLAC